MIRFTCPACRSVLAAPDGSAGGNVVCTRCGQLSRLKLPPPVANPITPTAAAPRPRQWPYAAGASAIALVAFPLTVCLVAFHGGRGEGRPDAGTPQADGPKGAAAADMNTQHDPAKPRGPVITVCGLVKVVSQDMDSFLEGLSGHTHPRLPVVILDLKHARRRSAWLDDDDDRFYSPLRTGRRVCFRGQVRMDVPGLLMFAALRPLARGRRRSRPPLRDKDAAAASDAEWGGGGNSSGRRSRRSRREEHDPFRKAGPQSVEFPLIRDGQE